MEEYATHGVEIMDNIKKILLDYKKLHGLTNFEMAVMCDLSLSEFDKIIYKKPYSKYGCTIDTFYKICVNLKIDANDLLGI